MSAGKEEPSRGEQTEEATPRKLEQLREQGRVAISHDLTAAACFAATLIVFVPHFRESGAVMATMLQRAMRGLQPDGASFHSLSLAQLGALRTAFFKAAIVPVLVGATVAWASGLLQTRGMFSPKLLAPDASRFDIPARLQQMLSTKAWVDALKGFAKAIVLVLTVFFAVRSDLPMILNLPRSGLGPALDTLSRCVLRLLYVLGGLFLAMGMIEYALAFFRHQRETKMSRQEIKDEHKEQEGDPMLRAKRKARARQLVKQRAEMQIKSATVVITNPTHYAVALRYRVGKDAVPIIIARSEGDHALAVRTAARSHGVPIIEHRALARALHAKGRVGRAIPVDLYRAVAEIIAHVLRIRGAAPRATQRASAS